MAVRKVDPVPALTLRGFQLEAGERVHLPDCILAYRLLASTLAGL